jgi:hypothetical protein
MCYYKYCYRWSRIQHPLLYYTECLWTGVRVLFVVTAFCCKVVKHGLQYANLQIYTLSLSVSLRLGCLILRPRCLRMFFRRLHCRVIFRHFRRCKSLQNVGEIRKSLVSYRLYGNREKHAGIYVPPHFLTLPPPPPDS